MSDASTLPFDFIEYLCAERRIERGAALKLLASELGALTGGERALPEARTAGSPSTPERPGKR